MIVSQLLPDRFGCSSCNIKSRMLEFRDSKYRSIKQLKKKNCFLIYENTGYLKGLILITNFINIHYGHVKLVPNQTVEKLTKFFVAGYHNVAVV